MLTMPRGLFVRLLSAVDLLAAAEAAGHPGRLKLSAPGRCMGREVTRHRQQNRVALPAVPQS